MPNSFYEASIALIPKPVEDSQVSSHTGPARKELRQLYLALAEKK
jgi:hypothetical protein